MDKETIAAPPTALPVKEVTADELALPLAEGMPEPTPGAVKEMPVAPTEAPKETTHAPPAPTNSSALTDRVGNVFDPAKYKSEPNGAPRYSKDRCFIPLNKGRPTGSGFGDGQPTAIRSKIPSVGAAPVSSPPSASPTPSAPSATQGPDEFDASAEVYFNTAIPLLSGLISNEWKPGTVYDAEKKGYRVEKAQEEKESITLPLAAYMRAKGKVDIPPGWVLTLGIAGYAGKRIQMPETAEKAESAFVRVKKWFGFKG